MRGNYIYRHIVRCIFRTASTLPNPLSDGVEASIANLFQFVQDTSSLITAYQHSSKLSSLQSRIVKSPSLRSKVDSVMVVTT